MERIPVEMYGEARNGWKTYSKIRFHCSEIKEDELLKLNPRLQQNASGCRLSNGTKFSEDNPVNKTPKVRERARTYEFVPELRVASCRMKFDLLLQMKHVHVPMKPEFVTDNLGGKSVTRNKEDIPTSSEEDPQLS